jgi:hypothetical protein
MLVRLQNKKATNSYTHITINILHPYTEKVYSEFSGIIYVLNSGRSTRSRWMVLIVQV